MLLRLLRNRSARALGKLLFRSTNNRAFIYPSGSIQVSEQDSYRSELHQWAGIFKTHFVGQEPDIEWAATGKLKVARDFLFEMRKNPFMPKSRLVAFLIKELRELVPPTVFFAVGFNLILLTTKLLLADYRVHFANFMVATMSALIVGKSVLVANAMQFLRRFDTAPKILPVLFKTTVYWTVVFLVRFAEKLVEYLLGGGALSAIPEYVATHFTWDRFAAIQIWIFVLFLVYTSIAELNGRLGHGELVKIFFTRHSSEMKSTRPAADSRVRQARPENRDR